MRDLNVGQCAKRLGHYFEAMCIGSENAGEKARVSVESLWKESA